MKYTLMYPHVINHVKYQNISVQKTIKHIST